MTAKLQGTSANLTDFHKPSQRIDRACGEFDCVAFARAFFRKTRIGGKNLAGRQSDDLLATGVLRIAAKTQSMAPKSR
jgi:hypothetical protein